MISVQNVSMRYGSKVLFEDVTTTFSKGRRYGLTGPNGAGKSTFMKLLTGDLPPQKGSVSAPDKLGVDVAPRLKTLKVEEPPKRKAGIKVKTVAELVDKLKNEAGVI